MKKVVGFSLSPEVIARVETLAAQEQRTRSQTVELLLDRALNALGKNEPLKPYRPNAKDPK